MYIMHLKSSSKGSCGTRNQNLSHTTARVIPLCQMLSRKWGKISFIPTVKVQLIDAQFSPNAIFKLDINNNAIL